MPYVGRSLPAEADRRRRAFLNAILYSYLPENTNVKYVYLIQSIPFPDQRYVGLTSDLKNRLSAHNEGRSPHTSKYKPWKLITYVAFSKDEKAQDFEKYIKSGSGRAFANKRLW